MLLIIIIRVEPNILCEFPFGTCTLSTLPDKSNMYSYPVNLRTRFVNNNPNDSFRSFQVRILPWRISVTYAIICTGHLIFKTCVILLSHTSCYYHQKLCYYQTPHAILHKTYVIIVQLVLLSGTLGRQFSNQSVLLWELQ